MDGARYMKRVISALRFVYITVILDGRVRIHSSFGTAILHVQVGFYCCRRGREKIHQYGHI